MCLRHRGHELTPPARRSLLRAGPVPVEDVLTHTRLPSPSVKRSIISLKGGFRPVALFFPEFSLLVHFTKTTHLALHLVPTLLSRPIAQGGRRTLCLLSNPLTVGQKPGAECVLMQPGKAPELASKHNPQQMSCTLHWGCVLNLRLFSYCCL